MDRKIIYVVAIIIIVFIISVFNNQTKENDVLYYKDNILTGDTYWENDYDNHILTNSYSSNLFKENNIYSIKEIEKKLNHKILRNTKIKETKYKADFISFKNNKISKIIFENVKSKKNKIVDIPLCIIVNTNLSTEEERNYLDIIDDSREIRYHIKKLDIDATIMISNEEDSGPLFAFFSYDNIIYELYMNRETHSLQYLYEVLESFYSSN